MKTHIAHNLTRLYPFIVCAITLPLVGCGVGGSSVGGAMPLPGLVATPALLPTPGPVATPAPIPTPTLVPVPTSTPSPLPTPGPVGETPGENGPLNPAEEAINRIRVAEGLAPLRYDRRLAQVAGDYARRMASEGFYSHNDPEGRSVLDRVSGTGYNWSVVGENLAWVMTKPGNEIGFAVDGWTNSAVHRANILRGDFTHSAVGVAQAVDGRTYLVQIFASPR